MAKKTVNGSIIPTLIFWFLLLSYAAHLLFTTPLPSLFPCYTYQKLWVIAGWLILYTVGLLMLSEFSYIKSARNVLYKIYFPFCEWLQEKEGIDFQGSLSKDLSCLLLRYLGLYLFILSIFYWIANLPFGRFTSTNSPIWIFILLGLVSLFIFCSYYSRPFIEYTNPELTDRTPASSDSLLMAIILVYFFPFVLFFVAATTTKDPFFISLIPSSRCVQQMSNGQLEELALTILAFAAVFAIFTNNMFNTYSYLLGYFLHREENKQMIMQRQTYEELDKEKANGHKPKEYEIKQEAQKINIRRENPYLKIDKNLLRKLMFFIKRPPKSY
jgi:hypothetical protein